MAYRREININMKRYVCLPVRKECILKWQSLQYLRTCEEDPAAFPVPFSFFKKLVLHLGLPSVLEWDEEKVEGAEI